MIGYLEQNGFRFGGKISLNKGNGAGWKLDTSGTKTKPENATLFALEFSESANEDGVAYRALELSTSIDAVRQLTGAGKIDLVAHSAGGIVARVYLQNALPEVPYRDNVARLITVGTPHLGAVLARFFGKFFGAQVSSLKPSAGLIQDLNNHLELPPEVLYASIIVRGLGADSLGNGKAYQRFIDPQAVMKLPVDLRLGGDQIVHVLSQNLALSRSARRYEQTTKQPILYPLVRIKDPSPEDISIFETKVHQIETDDPALHEAVLQLLQSGNNLWSHKMSDHPWVAQQARSFAVGAIENEALREHPLTQVISVHLDEFVKDDTSRNNSQYRLKGYAKSKGILLGIVKHTTHFKGKFNLSFDEFGRVIASQIFLAKNHIQQP